TLPNEFSFTVDPASAPAIVQKVAAGDLEDEVAAVPASIVKQYRSDPELAPSLHVDRAARNPNLMIEPRIAVHATGPKVKSWAFDTATGSTAYAHVGVS